MVRPILAACGGPFHAHTNLAVMDSVDFDQLAFACRLAPDEVDSRRYLRAGDARSDMPGVHFHGTIIPRYDLNLRKRVTPTWLRAGYHSALGHHGLVTHCPISGEILLDTCPRCERALNWTKSALAICHRCGFDLSCHDGAVVSEEEFAATRPMIDLVHPDQARHQTAVEAMPAQLHGFDRGLIFEAGWRMGCLITGHGQRDRDEAKRLPVERRLKILAAGSSALLNWPNSVTDALQGVVRGTVEGDDRLAVAARNFTNFRGQWKELRNLVRSSVPQLEIGGLQAVKATLGVGVNSAQLEKVLGVSQKVVGRLRETELQPVIKGGTTNLHEVFEAAELAGLRQDLDDRIPFGSIAERMNISRHGVEQLACLRELTIYDTGPVRIAFRQRQAKASDWHRILTRLESTSVEIEEDCSLAIGRAFRAIGGREKPWGPLIQAMMRGEIAFSLDDGVGRFMDRVRVRRDDLDKILNLNFQCRDYPGFTFERHINRRDTEELLNLNPKSFSAALKNGTIIAPGSSSYDRRKMLAAAAKYISESEILARWNGVDRRLPAPLRGKKRIKKICTLGWERAVIEVAMAGGLPG